MNDNKFIKIACDIANGLDEIAILRPSDHLDSELRTARELITALIVLADDYKREVGDPEDTPEHRDMNVGASNYAEHAIQPWDIWLEYQLNPWDADIVKRIVRTKVEGGMEPDEARILDYEKIIHICQERISQIKNGNPYYAKR
jgi:hypothetical protein